MFDVPGTDIVEVVYVWGVVCVMSTVCVRGGVCVCCVGAYPAGCNV